MQIIPAAFTELPTAIQNAAKRIYRNWRFILCLNCLLLPVVIGGFYLLDLAILKYLHQLQATTALGEHDFTRIIVISRIAAGLTLMPLLLVASYLPIHTQDVRLKKLLPQIGLALSAIAKGWTYGLISCAFACFRTVLIMCALGIFAELINLNWIQLILTLILALVLVSTLPSVTQILFCSWISLSQPQTVLNKSRPRAPNELNWLIGLALLLAVGLNLAICTGSVLPNYLSYLSKLAISAISNYLILCVLGESFRLYSLRQKK